MTVETLLTLILAVCVAHLVVTVALGVLLYRLSRELDEERAYAELQGLHLDVAVRDLSDRLS